MRNEIPRASREEVAERSGGVCEVCHRTPATHMHHRKPRRFKDHTPANLLHLCLLDHVDIHAHPARSYAAGLLLHSYEDPREVEVVR